MNEKLSMSSYLLVGSMLFGMFFGAGNLIFPVHMRLSSLRSQTAKAMAELTALSTQKTVGLNSHEEAVLAEFIQAAANSKYAQEAESHTQPVRISGTQITPNTAQSATQALYWPYWYQIF